MSALLEPSFGPSDFLAVRLGDFVVISEPISAAGMDKGDWWVGHVLHITGGARDPGVNSLFQVADVDTGVIRTISADLVKGIL